jgi:hypothetical protein
MPLTWGSTDECGVGLLVGENTGRRPDRRGNRRRVGTAHLVRFYGAKVVEVTGLAVVIETAESGGKRFDVAEVIEATEVRVDIKVVQRNRLRFYRRTTP